MDKDFTGLFFVNFVNFDFLWGHRRDIYGYSREIEKFDVNIGKLLKKFKNDSFIISDTGMTRTIREVIIFEKLYHF